MFNPDGIAVLFYTQRRPKGADFIFNLLMGSAKSSNSTQTKQIFWLSWKGHPPFERALESRESYSSWAPRRPRGKAAHGGPCQRAQGHMSVCLPRGGPL